VGYNWLAVIKNREPLYRWIQGIFQVLLSILIIILSGWIDAALFNFLWLCWACDWTYYLIDEITWRIFGKSFENGALTQLDLSNNCSWAWWTIYGLITGLNKNIKFKVLLYQSIIGIFIAVIIKCQVQ
jgi:hypothetical protein